MLGQILLLIAKLEEVPNAYARNFRGFRRLQETTVPAPMCRFRFRLRYRSGCAAVCVFLSDQRRSWLLVAVDLLRQPHHHRLILRAQPRSRRAQRVCHRVVSTHGLGWVGWVEEIGPTDNSGLSITLSTPRAGSRHV